MTPKDEYKQAVRDGARDAIREFLDESFATWGRWSAKALAAVILTALVIVALKTGGWQR